MNVQHNLFELVYRYKLSLDNLKYRQIKKS